MAKVGIAYKQIKIVVIVTLLSAEFIFVSYLMRIYNFIVNVRNA